MVRRDKANYTIQSVSHALDVLEQFTGETDELGVTELSKRLKLHKNNVFRLLATLEARGYIEQNRATENYRLGVRCLGLGQRFLLQTGLLRQAGPVLRELAASTNETAFVSVPQRDGAVVLDAVEPARTVRLVARIGEVLPLHCTAVGKVFLAFSDLARPGAGDGEAYARLTAATKTDPAAVREDLEAALRNGYALEAGEYADDVAAVAVPVHDYTRAVVASLSIAGPLHRLPRERLEGEIAAAIGRAGRSLSARLGYPAD